MTAAKPKIFISYSTSDRTVAALLYKDLSKLGAEVFQFEESATPGEPAWGEVLTKIEVSDIFILLASKSAVKSKPVQEEIKFAHYQYLNSNKPSILLPLVLEPNLQLPKEIRANNFIPFHNYQDGFSQLSKFLKVDTVPLFQTNTQEPLGLKRNQGSTSLSGNQAPWRPSKVQNFLPKLNTAAIVGNDMFWYAVIILLIGAGGLFLGRFANSLMLQYLHVEMITKTIVTWSEKNNWLPLASKLFFWMLTAYTTYNITDNEYPIDRSDYAIVTSKCVASALAFGLIWSFLFRQVAIETYPFILICIVISVIMVLVYAVLDLYF